MRDHNKWVSYTRSIAEALLLCMLMCLPGCSSREEAFLAETQRYASQSDEQEMQGTESVEETAASGPHEGMPTESPAEIYVDVTGAVESPGVYILQEGSRLYEALDAAGGVRMDGSTELLNRAAVLSDGQKIRVPTQEEVLRMQESDPDAGFPEEELTAGMQDAASENVSSGAGSLVDLNTAGIEELCTLAGIGQAKAEAIIHYREEHGAFRVIEELMQVEGIKQGTFDKIKDRLTVNE